MVTPFMRWEADVEEVGERLGGAGVALDEVDADAGATAVPPPSQTPRQSTRLAGFAIK